jgi:hypothetical protein
MTRRAVLLGLLLACVAQAVEPAYADGGGGSGGSGGGGSGGGGSGNSGSGSGGGSGNSGSGSGNSGNGSSDDDGEDGDDDWEQASNAAERGDIASLPFVLRTALANTPGKVIGVKLDHRGSSFIYRVKILARTGRKVELAIDARSRNIIRVN